MSAAGPTPCTECGKRTYAVGGVCRACGGGRYPEAPTRLNPWAFGRLATQPAVTRDGDPGTPGAAAAIQRAMALIASPPKNKTVAFDKGFSTGLAYAPANRRKATR